MICRHRFNGSQRLETVLYCYYINRARGTTDIVDLRKCSEQLSSYLIRIGHISNTDHGAQFIHPRFDAFFKYFCQFQESFEVLTNYPVINLCLQKSIIRNCNRLV